MILSGSVSTNTSYSSLLLGWPAFTSPVFIMVLYDVRTTPSWAEAASWQPLMAQLDTIKGRTSCWKYTVSGSQMRPTLPFPLPVVSMGLGSMGFNGSCVQLVPSRRPMQKSREKASVWRIVGYFENKGSKMMPDGLMFHQKGAYLESFQRWMTCMTESATSLGTA